MRNRIRWIIPLIILTVGAIICIIRWDVWFTNPQEPQWEGDELEFGFYTFGQNDVPNWTFNGLYWQDIKDPDTLCIVVLGDVHNQLVDSQWKAIYQRHPSIDCYAQAGDFMERCYNYYIQELYHQLSGTGFDSIPILAVPGNHEYRKGIIRRLPDRWLQMFPNPQNGPSGMKGSTYYVDMNGLRLILIDTNPLQRLSDYTRLNTWVNQVINDGKESGRYVMAIMHHPVHSVAKGRSNPLIALTLIRALKKADVVFTGHDHNYNRRLPFIGTTATARSHRINNKNSADIVHTGDQLYEWVTIYGSTMMIETRMVDTGEVIDVIEWPVKE
ncbi:MAG: metallophosphoesterase [Paludibacteraceae bacterium]|nr:metallophosphoesterase [Paludibacteraceae bacterium]